MKQSVISIAVKLNVYIVCLLYVSELFVQRDECKEKKEQDGFLRLHIHPTVMRIFHLQQVTVPPLRQFRKCGKIDHCNIVSQYEGPLRVLHTMMVDPNSSIKKPGGKDLHVTQGEVLDIVQLTSSKKALCRNRFGKCM